jgi:hypothetical protein
VQLGEGLKATLAYTKQQMGWVVKINKFLKGVLAGIGSLEAVTCEREGRSGRQKCC